MTKGKEKGSYDLAMIKQIVASGRDIVDRVMVQLMPEAAPRIVENHPGLESSRETVRMLLDTLFINGQITCPKCGARSDEEGENLCFGEEGNCPLPPMPMASPRYTRRGPKF